MDMKTMKRRALIAAGLIGLPVMTWALLAWEPFDRLLGHFFPEMFYDEVGRFVPLMPVEAQALTIILTVCVAVPVAVILLVVRSVRRRGFGMTAKKGAAGMVGILSVLWMVMIAVAGFIMDMLEVDEDYVRAEEEREEEEKEWDRIHHG